MGHPTDLVLEIWVWVKFELFSFTTTIIFHVYNYTTVNAFNGRLSVRQYPHLYDSSYWDYEDV